MTSPKHAILGAIIAGLLIAPAASAASATAPAATAKKYSSCSQLHQAYKGGVAKDSKVRNTKTVNGKKVLAKSEYKPKVSSSLYKANKGLDRDKDGIACEKA